MLFLICTVNNHPKSYQNYVIITQISKQQKRKDPYYIGHIAKIHTEIIINSICRRRSGLDSVTWPLNPTPLSVFFPLLLPRPVPVLNHAGRIHLQILTNQHVRWHHYTRRRQSYIQSVPFQIRRSTTTLLKFSKNVSNKRCIESNYF